MCIRDRAFVYVGENRDKALEEFAEPCMWYFRTFCDLIPAKEYPQHEGYYRNLHATLKGFVEAYDAGLMSFADIVEKSPFQHAFLVGDAEYVQEKLLALLDTYEGLSDVLCWTRLGGLDHKKVMSSMERLMNQVVGPLRASGALLGG